jgi:hypothetical protein
MNPTLNILSKESTKVSLEEKEKRRLLSALQNTIDNNKKALGDNREAVEEELNQLVETSRTSNTVNIKQVLSLTNKLSDMLGGGTENIDKILEALDAKSEVEVAQILRQTQNRLAVENKNVGLSTSLRTGEVSDLNSVQESLLKSASSDEELLKTVSINLKDVASEFLDISSVNSTESMKVLEDIRELMSKSTKLDETQINSLNSLLDSSESTITAIKSADKESISDKIKGKTSDDLRTESLANLTDKLNDIQLSSSIVDSLKSQSSAEGLGESAAESGIDGIMDLLGGRKGKRGRKGRRLGGRKGFKGGKGVGKLLTKLLPGLGGLSGAAGGALAGGTGLLGKAGGVLGKLGGVASKAALPLLAAKALYDGVQGYGEADDNFDLKKGQEATVGEGLSSSAGGIISGLSFGFIDSKDASQSVDSIADFATSSFKPPIINALEDKGIISTSMFGDSEIRDKSALSQLSKRELTELDKYDDWSDEDSKLIKDTLVAHSKAADMSKSKVPNDIIKMTTGVDPSLVDKPATTRNSLPSDLVKLDKPNNTNDKESSESTNVINDSSSVSNTYITSQSIYDPSFLNLVN